MPRAVEENTTGAPGFQARPRRKPVEITRARRAKVEQIVDELLQLLDTLDDDPDLEPSLGSYLPADGFALDAEADDSDMEEDDPGEESDFGEESDTGEESGTGIGDHDGIWEQAESIPASTAYPDKARLRQAVFEAQADPRKITRKAGPSRDPDSIRLIGR